MISSFELQIVTIVNSKPHKFLDSSIFNFDEATFCSSCFNFAFQLFIYDEATFCFWTSKSPTFFSLLPLAIITFNIQNTTISLLIFNFNEPDQKDKKKKGDGNLLPSPSSHRHHHHHHHHRRRWQHCCHHLFRNKTTEKGYDSYCHLFLQQSHRRRWWKLSLFFSSSQTQRKRRHNLRCRNTTT